MTKVFLTLLYCFFLTRTYGQQSLDGTYAGLEEKCWTLKSGKKQCYIDPLKPKWKWFNLTYLKIKGDSIFADQSPICTYKKDTIYSASDGGFYYYRGTLKRADGIATIQLTFLNCDYCGIPIKNNTKANHFPFSKDYTCEMVKEGLIINRYLFKRTNVRNELISEHL